MKKKSFAIITKFFFLILTGLFIISLTFAAENSRPNIVFILTDDMGWGDLSCHDHPEFRTPNIDFLAKNGVDFHQFYVTSPVCSPSRAGILTGAFPARHNILAQLEMRLNYRIGAADWLDPEAPSLARILQNAGYKTGHFGKWHLVEEAKNTPDAPFVTEYGFDVAEPMRGPWPGLGESLPKTTIRNVFERASEFIEESRDVPFFLNLSMHESHVPVGPTPEAHAANSHISNERKRQYAGVITDADNGVGLIIQTLRELGLENNTIMIFASDNGPAPLRDDPDHMYYYNYGSTGGRRGGKGTLYEGGVRMPLIIRWPGITPPGMIDKTTVVSAVDLLPTLVSIVHGTLPSNYIADGQNIQRALLGKPVRRESPILWYYMKKFAIRVGEWKLIADSSLNNAELYNIVNDPLEEINLAEINTATLNKLKLKISEWRESLPKNVNKDCISAYRPDQ